jgi:hypothetical protein
LRVILKAYFGLVPASRNVFRHPRKSKFNQQVVQVAISGYLHHLFWQFLQFDRKILDFGLGLFGTSSPPLQDGTNQKYWLRCERQSKILNLHTCLVESMQNLLTR